MGQIISLSSIVAGARQHINDSLAHHLYVDELSDQIDGFSNYYWLTNRNIVDKTNDGSPMDPVVTINNVVVSATFDKVNGKVTFLTAPSAGDIVIVTYYFVLMTDAEYVEYAQNLQNFLGIAVT